MPRSLQIRRGPAHDFTNDVVAESGADVKRHIFLPRIRRLMRRLVLRDVANDIGIHSICFEGRESTTLSLLRS